MLTADTTIAASRDQVSCDLAGEAAILNLKNSQYYGLNPVGALLWSMVQQPSTIGAIRDAIVKTYAIDAPQCERDVIALVEELAEEGLVEIAPAGAPA